MGIQGLLSFVKEAHEERIDIAEYKDRDVGIDISTWIFRGAYACALDMGEGEKTADSYVGYCMRRVQLLRERGVRPLLVFDGQRLPMKAQEHAARADARDKSRAEASSKIASGDRDGAEKAFQRCISVTPEMAKQVMKACDELHVRYLMAPYEADAELAFLQRNGHVAAVITEDSDLLVFGCQETLYKFDGEFGICVRIKLAKIIGPESKIRLKGGKGKRDIAMSTFDLDQFQRMCILSGCDYLPKKGKDTHVAGIGLKKAASLVMMPSIDAAVKFLRQTQPGTVPDGYTEAVERAERTFKHQIVYDPTTKELRPLSEHPPGISAADYPFAGKPRVESGDSTVQQLVSGKLDPRTLELLPSVQFSLQTLRLVNRYKSVLKRKSVTPERSPRNSILRFARPVPRGGFGPAKSASWPSLDESGGQSQSCSDPSVRARGKRPYQPPPTEPDPDISAFFPLGGDEPMVNKTEATTEAVIYVSDSQGESSNDSLSVGTNVRTSPRSKRAREGIQNPFATAQLSPSDVGSDLHKFDTGSHKSPTLRKEVSCSPLKPRSMSGLLLLDSVPAARPARPTKTPVPRQDSKKKRSTPSPSSAGKKKVGGKKAAIAQFLKNHLAKIESEGDS